MGGKGRHRGRNTAESRLAVTLCVFFKPDDCLLSAGRNKEINKHGHWDKGWMWTTTHDCTHFLKKERETHTFKHTLVPSEN